jgi:hypothetical protein
VHRARLSAASFIWGLRGQTIFWKIDLYDLDYKFFARYEPFGELPGCVLMILLPRSIDLCLRARLCGSVAVYDTVELPLLSPFNESDARYKQRADES